MLDRVKDTEVKNNENNRLYLEGASLCANVNFFSENQIIPFYR